MAYVNIDGQLLEKKKLEIEDSLREEINQV